MTGTRIPLGGYRVTVQCGEREAYCEITVQRTNQFEVFATRDRRMISDPVKPQLTIKLDPLPQPNDTWWIRLIGLYRSEIQADRFAPGTGVASISEPEPGRYLVTVLSAKGYVCVRRVDVLEFTKSWIFHSGDCSFEFDRHARLAPDDRGAVSTP